MIVYFLSCFRHLTLSQNDMAALTGGKVIQLEMTALASQTLCAA